MVNRLENTGDFEKVFREMAKKSKNVPGELSDTVDDLPEDELDFGSVNGDPGSDNVLFGDGQDEETDVRFEGTFPDGEDGEKTVTAEESGEDRTAETGAEECPAPAGPGTEEPAPAAVISSADKNAKTKNAAILHSADWMIALLPLVCWGVYAFGARVLAILTVSLLATAGLDVLIDVLLHKKCDVMNGVATVSGVIIALAMPVGVPLWLVFTAGAVSVLIRRAVNRSGYIRLNPAAAGIAIAYFILPSAVRNMGEFGVRVSFFGKAAEGVDYALRTLIGGEMPDKSFGSLFFGVRNGTVGEISAVLITVGFLFLLARRTVRPETAVTVAVSAGIAAALTPNLAMASDVILLKYALYHLLCGDLIFTAVFICSDTESDARTSGGRIAVGVLGGAALILSRRYLGGNVPSAAIVLLMNLVTYPVDSFFRNRGLFGGPVSKAKK